MSSTPFVARRNLVMNLACPSKALIVTRAYPATQPKAKRTTSNYLMLKIPFNVVGNLKKKEHYFICDIENLSFSDFAAVAQKHLKINLCWS